MSTPHGDPQLTGHPVHTSIASHIVDAAFMARIAKALSPRTNQKPDNGLS